MRETQFIICLIAMIGLILLMVLTIFIFRKRLPTLQKKIFFAQVWLASMIVILMPLYYHFYKVAMYYSMSVFFFAIVVAGAAYVYTKSVAVVNLKVNYYQSFIVVCMFIMAALFLFNNYWITNQYFTDTSSGNEHWFGFIVNYGLSSFLALLLIPIPQFYAKEKNYNFIKFYGIYILIIVLFFTLARISIIGKSYQFIKTYPFPYNQLKSISFYMLILIIPSCMLYCSTQIYLLNRKIHMHKNILISNILNITIGISYIMIVSYFNFETYELLSDSLNFWHFTLIAILNTSMLIPYILMSHTIMFAPKPKENNSDQPAQINHEPSP